MKLLSVCNDLNKTCLQSKKVELRIQVATFIVLCTEKLVEELFN